MPKKRSSRKRQSAFAIQKPSRVQRMLGENRVNFTNLGQVVRKVEQLSSQLAPERKYNEDASDRAAYRISGTTPLDYSTCFGALANNINQGAGVEQRIGQKIRCTDITWKLTIDLADGVASDTVNYRLILLIVKQPSADNASLDLLLHQYLSNSDVSPYIATLTGINRDNSSNFVILKDKTYDLNDVMTTSRTHKIYKKLNFETEYFGTNSGDISSNAIWYIVIPNTQTNSYVFNTSYMRLNFIDV